MCSIHNRTATFRLAAFGAELYGIHLATTIDSFSVVVTGRSGGHGYPANEISGDGIMVKKVWGWWLAQPDVVVIIDVAHFKGEVGIVCSRIHC